MKKPTINVYTNTKKMVVPNSQEKILFNKLYVLLTKLNRNMKKVSIQIVIKKI